MPVNVLFFGSTAAVTGKRRVAVDLAGDSRASEVFDRLLTEYPRLAAHKLLFSVNQQYSTGEEIVKDGDELAIFTAVSGG
jgi:molybdopterin converting factor small subunit